MIYKPVIYQIITVVATYRDKQSVLHDVKHQVFNLPFAEGLALITRLMTEKVRINEWVLIATVSKLTE